VFKYIYRSIMHLLENGISIPSSYTSYIAPLSSAKLHAEVTALQTTSRFETPYVVLFNAIHQTAEPQATWTFEHPLRHSKTNALLGNYLNCSSFNAEH
jgi:protein arginine N-methyltransferase 5